LLENTDTTTKILQVFKEEIEEKKRLANKISHATYNSEDKACDLLIEGGCCSLHKKEHYYTLRSKKDTTKSKPMVKMKKIIGFPNYWLEDGYLFKEGKLCVHIVPQVSNLFLHVTFKGISA
jgi:hypothetical protein